MTISPAVLDALLASGATAEMIVAAVKADSAEAEARKVAKREGNRLRQARFKAARRGDGNADNALPSVTERDGALPPPPPDKSPPDPQKLTPTPAHSGTQTRARKAGDFPCPEGVDPEHWSDFLANRKTKRLTNTPTAYRGVLRELAKLADDEWPPGRIVEFAAARGWGAIFDPRNREQTNGRHRTQNGMAGNQPDDGIGPTARSAIAAFPDVFGPDAGHPGTVGH